MPGVDLDRRLPIPAGVLTFQHLAEEPLLQRDAIVGVELGEVLQPVHFQPLVCRTGPGPGLEVAASVQMVGPVRRRQHRHGDLLGFPGPLPVVRLIQRTGPQFGGRVTAVGGQLRVGQHLRPGDRLSSDRVRRPLDAGLDR